MSIIAQDTFNRTVAAGSWGSADSGGAWTVVQGGAANFSVQPGHGVVAMTPSADRRIVLGDISTTTAIVRVAVTSSSGFSGGPQTINIVGRYISPSDSLMARIRIEDGVMRLYIMRNNETALGHYPLEQAYVSGQKIWCEMSVTGTNPTTVAAKMWLDSESEPETYQITNTDTTAAYQVPGAVMLRTNFSSGAAAATIRFSDFSVTDPTFAALDTPVVTLASTSPSTVGGTNGSITATWPAVPGADYYETALVSGTVTSGFVADDTNATSPKTYTNLPAGIYTVAVQAKAD